MSPTIEQFRALARSSPWRWRTLRFEAQWRGRPESPVRAWVRRPDGVRVEGIDGAVLLAARQEWQPGSLARLTSGGGAPVGSPPLAADAPPVYGSDGLVRQRPSLVEVRYDDPMYRDYHWVAMLDPVELADGRDLETDDPGLNPVEIDDLHVVDHHGRTAWEASLRPTSSYDPRCACCALLFSAESEARDAQAGGSTLPDGNAGQRYAEAHRVRLDVATGVCVFTEEVGGSHAGNGHELRLQAADEPMADRLFETTRSG